MAPRKQKRGSSPKPVKKPKEPRPPRPLNIDGHQCALCPKIVARDSRMSHACHVHGESVLFECGYCWKQFKGNKKIDVIRHMKSMHEGLDPEEIADYRENLKEEMKKLQEKCFPPVKKAVVCEVEEEKDNSEVVNETQKSKPKAGNSFAEELRADLQNGSGSSNDLQCTQCNLIILCRKNAERHACSHANLPLYECKYCNRKFSAFQQKTLYTHIRNEHKKIGQPVNKDDFHDNRDKLEVDIQLLKKKCFPRF
ncbi:hypothetical protein CAEBREN_25834 [Caenorhabditis brenneri]|uniref:C2H2-type domain-containing protein n=1 Tax=Caenorhabditis brenneri TaxID=135651 RepID=G0MY90_CAEBE|nr:hypothetical protein CAEBREN_25834 [Caenorhabditis brenneri]